MHRTLTSLLLVPAFLFAAPSRAEDIAVIVNPGRTAQLEREEIAQIYLKKRRFWDDGTPILPVNQNAGSALRSSFDKVVFGARVRRLSVYWNREYFRGVLPPATLASDEAVRRFVASEPRAVGYIRAGGADPTIRVILTLTGSP